MNTRVLVTGGHGFIGSHMVPLLIRKGYRVRVADIIRLESLDGYEFIRGDLTDRQFTLEAFAEVDVCVNMAAVLGGIRFFNEYPAEILDKNAQILSSTFEAARQHKVKHMIYISSSCVFDNSPAHPVTEHDLSTAPTPPPGYPFSRLLGESYCKSYFAQYGLSYTILRPFNAMPMVSASDQADSQETAM